MMITENFKEIYKNRKEKIERNIHIDFIYFKIDGFFNFQATDPCLSFFTCLSLVLCCFLIYD